MHELTLSLPDTRICISFSTVYNDTLVAIGLIISFIWCHWEMRRHMCKACLLQCICFGQFAFVLDSLHLFWTVCICLDSLHLFWTVCICFGQFAFAFWTVCICSQFAFVLDSLHLLGQCAFVWTVCIHLSICYAFVWIECSCVHLFGKYIQMHLLLAPGPVFFLYFAIVLVCWCVPVPVTGTYSSVNCLTIHLTADKTLSTS